MSLAFSVKMDESQLALYKKQQRRENRSKVRQAVFVSEYVFYKHFDIYQEAAQLYNHINQLYPRKPDLRRTEEFRVWKNNVTGQPNIRKRKPTVKRQPYVFPPHANIPVAEYIDPNASFVVMDQAESPRPESPRPESPRPESPRPENPQPENPQPESPQPESLQPESPSHRIKNRKVMELKIPLMNPPTKTHPLVTQEVTQEVPSIITETLQTVTDEVLQEYTVDAIEPSLYEEISPEIIDKIIEELCQDPGLKDIATAVEEQLELEQVGLDIDIEIDDRLEAELENILW